MCVRERERMLSSFANSKHHKGNSAQLTKHSSLSSSSFYVPLYSSLSQPTLPFTCLTSSSHQLLYFSINPLSSSSYPASVASLTSPQILPPSQYFPSSTSSPLSSLPSSVPSEHCSVTAQLVTACQETAPFVPR